MAQREINCENVMPYMTTILRDGKAIRFDKYQSGDLFKVFYI